MNETLALNICPCGSHKNYSECCGPLLSGEKLATTPEALMRSRYTAFTVKNIDYLFSSMTPELQQHNDKQDLQDFADEVEAWVKLEVLNAPAPDVDHGAVEFAAYFMYEGEQQRIHENSQFVKIGDQWFYAGHQHQCSSHAHDHDDDEPDHHHHHVHDEHCSHNHHHEPYRAEIKIGRNDPCPCGSGKKYKKCCID